MDKLNRTEVILDAVEKLKNSPFKATAIKVELEAHLGRSNAEANVCVYCSEGMRSCTSCGGDWHRTCERCDGVGVIANNSTEFEQTTDCICDDGSVLCTECFFGKAPNCADCNGYGTVSGDASWSQRWCHATLMEKLSELGLAESKDELVKLGKTHLMSAWHPKGALKYAEFYSDGSVDSEFTFTLSLKNPEDIFLLEKIVRIWDTFCKDAGPDYNVSGAGMHMALLNHPECKYGGADNYQEPTSLDTRRFSNFSKSMSLLQPALFFLSSTDSSSRPLKFREPGVTTQKYSAIAYRESAIEFRCFQTCYKNPSQILDNLVVIKNCMKYWRLNYKPSGVEKITRELKFGNSTSSKLARMYTTLTHVQVLDVGLKKLKPSYLTVREIKQQRQFQLTKRHFTQIVKKTTEEAKLEFEEYEERFDWSLKIQRDMAIANNLAHTIDYAIDIRGVDREEAQTRAVTAAEEHIEYVKSTKKNLERFIEDKIATINKASAGQYTLTA